MFSACYASREFCYGCVFSFRLGLPVAGACLHGVQTISGLKSSEGMCADFSGLVFRTGANPKFSKLEVEFRFQLMLKNNRFRPQAATSAKCTQQYNKVLRLQTLLSCDLPARKVIPCLQAVNQV